MEKNFTYKPEILVEMAQEYLNAENDARIFYRRHRPFPGLPLVLQTEESRISYERHDKESSCTWSAFVSACRLVNADPDAVMATVKAMNRYEKRERWQVCAHLPSGYDWHNHEDRKDTLRRFWSAPDPDADYFQSTGRRKPWTVEQKAA